MVCHAGMIEAVQIGTVQYILTLITEYIQVIFQKNLIAGQGSGFIHTKNIHAAEALHGVDIFTMVCFCPWRYCLLQDRH